MNLNLENLNNLATLFVVLPILYFSLSFGRFLDRKYLNNLENMFGYFDMATAMAYKEGIYWCIIINIAFLYLVFTIIPAYYFLTVTFEYVLMVLLYMNTLRKKR